MQNDLTFPAGTFVALCMFLIHHPLKNKPQMLPVKKNLHYV